MATVDPHYAKSIIHCLTRQGIDTAALLQELELLDIDSSIHHSEKTMPIKETFDRNRDLALKNKRIAGDTITFLVKHTWAVLNDEFMGCTKHKCKQGVFALMSRYALRHDNLKHALEQAIHFYNLFTNDIHMELSSKGDNVEFLIQFSEPGLDVDNFFQEFWLVIWHRFSSWMIGEKILLNQVSFPYSKPAHYGELKHAFPCRLNFDQPKLKFSFDKRYLAMPPIRNQRDLDFFLRNSPADFITIPGNENSYVARIRNLLISQSQHGLICPPLEALAEQFNMSSQTLRRKLKLENSSYPQIKDNIRRDIAIDQLRKKTLAITDIAHLLGFSEARSFTRAFRKWTGVAPSQYVTETYKSK